MLQAGVRATVGVFLTFSVLAAVSAAVLPFETKGRELADRDDEADVAETADGGSLDPGGGSHNYGNSGGKQSLQRSRGASGGRRDVQMQPVSRGGSQANPFHMDDVSSQTLGGSVSVVGDSRAGDNSRVAAQLEHLRK
jgi:hypothetical protein